MTGSTSQNIQKLHVAEPQFICEQTGDVERELKARWLETFEEMPGVESAYLARVTYGAASDLAVALCLRMKDMSLATPVITQCSAEFASLFGTDQMLDILLLTPEQERALRAICPPFFRAKSAILSTTSTKQTSLPKKSDVPEPPEVQAAPEELVPPEAKPTVHIHSMPEPTPPPEVKPPPELKLAPEAQPPADVLPLLEAKPEPEVKPPSELKVSPELHSEADIHSQSEAAPQQEVKPPPVVKPQAEEKPLEELKPPAEVKPPVPKSNPIVWFEMQVAPMAVRLAVLPGQPILFGYGETARKPAETWLLRAKENPEAAKAFAIGLGNVIRSNPIFQTAPHDPAKAFDPEALKTLSVHVRMAWADGKRWATYYPTTSIPPPFQSFINSCRQLGMEKIASLNNRV